MKHSKNSMINQRYFDLYLQHWFISNTQPFNWGEGGGGGGGVAPLLNANLKRTQESFFYRINGLIDWFMAA